jgi:hypothetical protein
MTASEMRNRLVSLHAERALVLTADPLRTEETLAELDREITFAQAAYVGFGVTEIATLRGALSGRPQG